MTDITPADLARFVHPVPVGATIPAGMEFEAVEAAEPELPTGLTEAQRDGRRRPHPQLITCATCQAGPGHPCRRPDGTRSTGHHQIRAEGVRAWWAGWNAAKAEQ